MSAVSRGGVTAPLYSEELTRDVSRVVGGRRLTVGPVPRPLPSGIKSVLLVT